MSKDFTPQEMIKAIDSAVLAERERCAKLALTVKADKMTTPCEGHHFADGTHCADRRAAAIAAAIRSP